MNSHIEPTNWGTEIFYSNDKIEIYDQHGIIGHIPFVNSSLNNEKLLNSKWNLGVALLDVAENPQTESNNEKVNTKTEITDKSKNNDNSCRIV